MAAWRRTRALEAPPVNRGDVPTPMQWYTKAMGDLERVRTAESRLVGALGGGVASVRAAADELQVATRDAIAWLTETPNPDRVMTAKAARLVKAYAALQQAAQESAAYPELDALEARNRLRDLIDVVDYQSQKLSIW